TAPTLCESLAWTRPAPRGPSVQRVGGHLPVGAPETLGRGAPRQDQSHGDGQLWREPVVQSARPAGRACPRGLAGGGVDACTCVICGSERLAGLAVRHLLRSFRLCPGD